MRETEMRILCCGSTMVAGSVVVRRAKGEVLKLGENDPAWLPIYGISMPEACVRFSFIRSIFKRKVPTDD